MAVRKSNEAPAPKRVGGDVSSFKAHTLALAKANGWKAIVASDGNVTFSRGGLTVTVNYSEKSYVRKAEGAFTLRAEDKRKWIRLNEFLAATQ